MKETSGFLLTGTHAIELSVLGRLLSVDESNSVSQNVLINSAIRLQPTKTRRLHISMKRQ